MSDDSSEVLADQQGPVLLLTLNRPQRLNAWTPDMQREYFSLLDKADQDPSIRAVVLTGAGRGFCAGADLAMLGGLDADTYAHNRGPMSQPLRMRKPVISAINGPVAGLGLIAALFTDIRFAAEDATFTTAFSRRGLVAEHGVAWLLPRIIGLSKALDILLSARTFAGAEAGELGLADRVLPREKVVDAALSYANTLATQCSPASVADIKQQVYLGLDSGLDTATADAASRMAVALGRPDFGEGLRAFREKRAPAFPPLES